jgi:hypothetical protein
MPEDRTTPMRQPQWSRQDQNLDDQETVYADQDSPTPPTLPLGDQQPAGWGPPAGPPGFVRATPAAGTTPEPFPAPRPGGFQPAAPPADQTMVIAERPKPVFAWLVVVDSPDRGSIGQVHSLRPDTTTLGRASGNHIALRDDTASAQHARIRIEAREGEEPAFVLYDMGSSNGTYVGDKKTYKDEETRTYRHQLQDGDYVLIGETSLAFKKL